MRWHHSLALIACCLAAISYGHSVHGDVLDILAAHPMLQTRNVETIEAFQAATGYNYTLAEETMLGGIFPDLVDQRLRRVLLKWLAGNPVKLGIVGGSIALGTGASKIGETDWFSRVSNFFKTAHANAKVSSRNGAVSATTAKYMSLCFENHVDRDVDLLLVEYAVNDGYQRTALPESAAAPYEHIVRKALALPHSPAVMLTNLFRFAEKATPQKVLPYYFSAEEAYIPLSSYYRLPRISTKSALYQKVLTRQPGFEVEKFTVDNLHPNDLGARYYGDLVVFLIQKTLLEMARNLAEMRSPLHVTTGTASRSGPPAADSPSWSSPIPAPLIPNNYESKTRMCIDADAMGGIVVTSKGFTYGYDDKHGLYGSHKWGWVGNAAGSSLVLKVPGVQGAASQAVLHLGYLKSYENMGVAKLECAGACKCSATLLEGHHNARVSQTYTARLPFTWQGECHVKVTIMDKTSSGKRKFKVTSLVVTDK